MLGIGMFTGGADGQICFPESTGTRGSQPETSAASRLAPRAPGASRRCWRARASARLSCWRPSGASTCAGKAPH